MKAAKQTKKPFQRVLSLALITALLSALLITFTIGAILPVNAVPSAASGNTLVVKNGNDSGSGSLRDVVANAKDGDTITFDPSVATVVLTSAQITITQKKSDH
jgi:hypothetical protein